MYSSLETGSTSTGSPSHWSGHDRLHFIIGLSPPAGSLVLLDDLEGPAHRRMDAAEVRHDLAGPVALGRRDGGAPLRVVLDAADRRRAVAELGGVEIERAAEARRAVGQREGRARGPGTGELAGRDRVVDRQPAVGVGEGQVGAEL